MAPLTSEQMRDYMEPFPKLARGNGTIRVASPPQTLSQMLASIQHFNPKSGVKAPPAWGRLQGFRPMRIPVVFHCEWMWGEAWGWGGGWVGVCVEGGGALGCVRHQQQSGWQAHPSLCTDHPSFYFSCVFNVPTLFRQRHLNCRPCCYCCCCCCPPLLPPCLSPP